MNYLFNSVRSNIQLTSLYKEIFPPKKLLKEFISIALKSRPFPLTINLLISNQCNFSCNMCSWKKSGSSQNYNEETSLNIHDIKNFISQVKTKYPVIHIGGGEPFMRRDLPEILAVIKNNKLKCMITTNGFLLNEDVIEKMVELEIDMLIFSLYGWGETHDYVTGVNGSFNKVITNLKSILEKRTKHTKVLVSTIPLPENINGLEQLIKNLYMMGVDRIKIEQLNFLALKEKEQLINNASFNLNFYTFIKDSYFDQKFITDLVNVYKEMKKTFRDFVYFKPFLTEKQIADWYGALPRRLNRCLFITHSVFINHNGDIIPCQFLQDCALGNIKTDSLESVWRSSKYNALRKNIGRLKPINCLRCCKN